ncbi:MBL fold metallo-hydrolase [Nocardia inohanensis]|uniref:MBL fold metallo-hydrolase n=1 Tax=Nocardia inohanensis TaxID=209246 RepID=UPI000831F775|nr:MBL fold metallo-hydrolase [Nocardia inohanensis]
MNTPLAVTSYGHATVKLENHDLALVIDPGTIAPPAAFERVTAFLVTHEHDDHLDVDRVAEALSANTAAHAWTPESAAQRLIRAGVDERQITIISSESEFDAAGIAVQPILGRHATIHPKLPESPNIAYLIDHRILHPGDAFPPLPGNPDIDVLFLPVSGPWMRISDAIDYVAATHPEIVIPIHDGDLNDIGRTLTDQLGPLIEGDGRYQRLRTGEPIVF